MSRVTWKENKIIGIEIQKGIYSIAQMTKSPYLVFFNLFQKDTNFSSINLTKTPILFVQAVTKQFLKKSNVKTLKINPSKKLEVPKKWIFSDMGSRKVKVWEGTKMEKEFITFGKLGASLVEKDIFKDGKYSHPSGIFDKVIIKKIICDDIIDKYELANIEVYPSLNERLRLCHELGRNVNPAKDILFNRKLPYEYKIFVDILSGSVDLSELGY